VSGRWNLNGPLAAGIALTLLLGGAPASAASARILESESVESDTPPLEQQGALAAADLGEVEGDGNSCRASLSADGRYVAFGSNASNLVVGDTNGVTDVFVRDRGTGETTRVSVDSAGVEGNHDSHFPSISADGRYVAFMSLASNLVAGDASGTIWQIFVHDRVTSETTRVSVDSAGVEANDQRLEPSISADGRYVYFYSYASNLVVSDANGACDVFVHDRVTGETTRVSVDSAGVEANGGSEQASVSADGRYVTFCSYASNLVVGDTNGFIDTS